MMVGALVLPLEMTGMIEASATRGPAMPWTHNSASTTAFGPPSDPARPDRMQRRHRSALEPILQIGVALIFRPRREFASQRAVEGGLDDHLAHHVNRRCRGVAVEDAGEVISVDQRRIVRSCGVQRDPTTTLRIDRAEANGEAVIGLHRGAAASFGQCRSAVRCSTGINCAWMSGAIRSGCGFKKASAS